MDKETICRFLKERRRGSYSLLVELYADVVPSMAITLALTVIKEDLERASGSKVELHYFSLAKAISRFKKKTGKKATTSTPQKWNFRDANESKDSQTSPGKFKLSQDVQ
jgi:hypothetical protein